MGGDAAAFEHDVPGGGGPGGRIGALVASGPALVRRRLGRPRDVAGGCEPHDETLSGDHVVERVLDQPFLDGTPR